MPGGEVIYLLPNMSSTLYGLALAACVAPAVTSQTPWPVYGIYGNASRYTVKNIWSGADVTNKLPDRGYSWGRTVVANNDNSPAFCSGLPGTWAWSLAQASPSANVTLEFTSLDGLGYESCITPFANVNATWILGTGAEHRDGDCSLYVAGRVGDSYEGDWHIGRLTARPPPNSCAFILDAIIDGSYDKDIEDPGTVDPVGGAGGQGVAYFTLSRMDNATSDYQTFAVAVDVESGAAAFCKQDWRDMTGRNMDTMDWDPSQGAVIGIGMNNTGATSDPARCLVKLRIGINDTSLEAADPAGAKALRLRSQPQTHVSSPAVSCSWTALTQQYDHPIDVGGLSALVPWSVNASYNTTALVWLGSQPMNPATDAVVWDAVTADLLYVQSEVCYGADDECYISLGRLGVPAAAAAAWSNRQ